MLSLLPIAVPCALAVVTALCVVLLRRPVHVALGLLGHSLAMAALYLGLSSEFSAVAQTLIYSGAIVVLFLIVVALLPEGGREKLSAGGLAAALFVGIAMVAGLSMLFAGLPGRALPTISGKGFRVDEIGSPLFKSLIVPFELTAPLLLAAIVTAIALWRRQEKAPAKGGVA